MFLYIYRFYISVKHNKGALPKKNNAPLIFHKLKFRRMNKTNRTLCYFV